MLPKLLAITILGLSSLAQAAKAPPPPPEIVFRHAMTGEAAAALVEFVGRFNAEGKSGKVVLQHVGMAADPHQLPHLALLEDEEYQKFFDSHPRMLPLYKVMAGAKVKFDAAALFPVLADVVDDNKGRIQALPLALSVPVLYFNKDTFRKAKLDPAKPPLTWWELQTAAGKVFDVDRRCPFTSSNPAWVLLENAATQHGEPIASSEQGGKTALALNNLVQVKHVALLASWHKSFYFRTFGPGREADEKFMSGECSMLTSDSSLYLQLLRRKPFDFGIAALPHYDDVRGAAPGRLLPDGAALWVLAGKKKPEYAVVASFISFMMRPDVQQQWVRSTGYLPMTPAAVSGLAAEGAPPELLRKAVERLSDRRFASAAKPKGVFGMSRVRAILHEELEAVWANLKPAKEALDTAVRRGNPVLQPMPTDGTVTR
ncbi:MAG: sn-glycerol-3-phosphate ABC transporter substrate-binding protein [Betaproteobacteria bacterium]|nr:MAG: sn-glycerol-3-phosphate ABC transporter substrate-binding protein [Betaproteobacteria bacterium]